jgi:soluble lytic murein transglycosylase-like protein
MRRTLIFVFVILAALSLTAFALASLAINPESEDSSFTYFLELYKPSTVKSEKFYTREEINTLINKQADRANLIKFYTQYTGDWTITKTILDHAVEYNIPINLAFSLAYVESKFNPRAFNRNGSHSVDRGLFQLNNAHRQSWKVEDYYDINKNTEEGLSYLYYCIAIAENDITRALAAYNGGPKMVKIANIPVRVQNYIDEILRYEDCLNQSFNNFIREKR